MFRVPEYHRIEGVSYDQKKNYNEHLYYIQITDVNYLEIFQIFTEFLMSQMGFLY